MQSTLGPLALQYPDLFAGHLLPGQREVIRRREFRQRVLRLHQGDQQHLQVTHDLIRARMQHLGQLNEPNLRQRTANRAQPELDRHNLFADPPGLAQDEQPDHLPHQLLATKLTSPRSYFPSFKPHDFHNVCTQLPKSANPASPDFSGWN